MRVGLGRLARSEGGLLSAQFADYFVNMLPVFEVGAVTLMPHFICAFLSDCLCTHSVKADHLLCRIDDFF
jgi:hypothetical protein